MDVLDLNAIITSSGADTTALAEAIYPENRQPKAAFSRVLSREAYLNEIQISRLANFIGCSVADLYTRSKDLKVSGDEISLKVGGSVARLDLSTMKLEISNNDTIIHDTVFMRRGITIDELKSYVEQWDKL